MWTRQKKPYIRIQKFISVTELAKSVQDFVINPGEMNVNILNQAIIANSY